MSEPIRILHIVTTMDTGGVETLLMNLYRKIDRTKVQFDFLKHRDSHDFYDNEILALGGRLYPGIPFTPLKLGTYRRFLREFFQAHPEYKIVHAHTHYNSYALQEAKNCGVPVRIAHAHIAYPKIDRKYPFKLYNKLTVGRFATGMLSCSKPASRWFFGKQAARSGKVIVLNNGIRTENFAYDPAVRERKRQELGLKDAFTLIHVGRFEEQKNHTFLLDVFAEVLKKEPDAALLLVGDGSIRDRIEKKAEDMGISEHIQFLGVHGDVHELLQAGDVFVFPSLYEGLGIVAVEAQAAGLPCVISDTIPKDVVVLDSLKALPLEKPEDWADAILAWRGRQDERHVTTREIRDAGFEISEVANWLENYYEEALCDEES